MTLWYEYFGLLDAMEGIQILVGINLDMNKIIEMGLPQDHPDKIFVFLDAEEGNKIQLS